MFICQVRFKIIVGNSLNNYPIRFLEYLEIIEFVYSIRLENQREVLIQKARDAMKSASDSSIATVFYAYAPSGKYLGGDVWNNE